MKDRIRRVVARVQPGNNDAAILGLQKQIDELKAELDETRRNNLRVAEMLDLLELRLTPEPPGRGE